MLAGIDVMMNWLPGLLRGLMIRAECLMAGDGGLPSVGLMIGGVGVVCSVLVRPRSLASMAVVPAMYRVPVWMNVLPGMSAAAAMIISCAMPSLPMTVATMLSMPDSVIIRCARLSLRGRAFVGEMILAAVSLMIRMMVPVGPMGSTPGSVIRANFGLHVRGRLAVTPGMLSGIRPAYLRGRPRIREPDDRLFGNPYYCLFGAILSQLTAVVCWRLGGGCRLMVVV